jgi:hypothetical protein
MTGRVLLNDNGRSHLPHYNDGFVTTVAARKLFQDNGLAGPTYLSVTEEGLRIKPGPLDNCTPTAVDAEAAVPG